MHGTGSGWTPAGSFGVRIWLCRPFQPEPAARVAHGQRCRQSLCRGRWACGSAPPPGCTTRAAQPQPPPSFCPHSDPIPSSVTSTPLLRQVLRVHGRAGTSGPSLREVGFTGTLGQGWCPRQISRSGTSSPISQVLPRLSPAPSAQLSPML